MTSQGPRIDYRCYLRHVATARQIAFDILMAVDRGGYAADLLTARCTGLDHRDAGLTASIVLGTLRYRPQLDHLINHFSGRNAKLDPEVRQALRMGIFQLRYLDRIPAHAAVGESVELVKRAHKKSATGFTNAILRRVTRDAVRWPTREIEFCTPEWMLVRWNKQFGKETAEGIANASLETPARFIRVPAGTEPPSGSEPTEIPGCYRTDYPGTFRIQDIGSQSLIPLLDLQPGMRFLDLCAAPGNKTAQAIEAGVNTIACDVNMNRLHQLKPLGIALVQLDAEQPLPFDRVFDRILVDAPCSGTGTLAHNPEIKWRLRGDEIQTLAVRQRRIVENAANLLKPGGILVYSTCSLEFEENEAVVDGLTSNTTYRIPGKQAGDGFFAAVIS